MKEQTDFSSEIAELYNDHGARFLRILTHHSDRALRKRPVRDEKFTKKELYPPLHDVLTHYNKGESWVAITPISINCVALDYDTGAALDARDQWRRKYPEHRPLATVNSLNKAKADPSKRHGKHDYWRIDYPVKNSNSGLKKVGTTEVMEGVDVRCNFGSYINLYRNAIVKLLEGLQGTPLPENHLPPELLAMLVRSVPLKKATEVNPVPTPKQIAHHKKNAGFVWENPGEGRRNATTFLNLAKAYDLKLPAERDRALLCAKEWGLTEVEIEATHKSAAKARDIEAEPNLKKFTALTKATVGGLDKQVIAAINADEELGTIVVVKTPGSPKDRPVLHYRRAENPAKGEKGKRAWVELDVGEFEDIIQEKMDEIKDLNADYSFGANPIANTITVFKREGYGTKLIKAAKWNNHNMKYSDTTAVLIQSDHTVIDKKTGKEVHNRKEWYETRTPLPCPAFNMDNPPLCPVWDKFALDCGNQDPAFAEFLNCMGSYALLGGNPEEIFFFLLGPGGTGKTTFTEVLLHILGTMAQPIRKELYSAKSADGHSAPLAALKGKQVLVSDDVQISTLDTGFIGNVVSGTTTSGRLIGKDEQSMTINATMFFQGNDLPSWPASGDGMIARRIVVVPFNQTQQNRDPMLKWKLKEEAAAITAKWIKGISENYLSRADNGVVFVDRHPLVIEATHKGVLAIDGASAGSAEAGSIWRKIMKNVPPEATHILSTNFQQVLIELKHGGKERTTVLEVMGAAGWRKRITAGGNTRMTATWNGKKEECFIKEGWEKGEDKKLHTLTAVDGDKKNKVVNISTAEKIETLETIMDKPTFNLTGDNHE